MGILFELRQGKEVSAYCVDITVIVSDASQLETVGTTLKQYKPGSGTKGNANKSVGCGWAPRGAGRCHWTAFPGAPISKLIKTETS